MSKKVQKYDSEYYEWCEYSKNCPWKEKSGCCSVTYTMCMCTRCAVWYFLKRYKELNCDGTDALEDTKAHVLDESHFPEDEEKDT